MTEARSKRRVLPLVFIVKSFTKSLLIKLEYHNFIHESKQMQVHDFRLKRFNTRRHSRNPQQQRGKEK